MITRMAKFNFSKVRALIGEQSPILRKGIRHALSSTGVREITDCGAFADVFGHLERERYDLVVVNSEIEASDTTFLIREVRCGNVHKDPFLVALLVVTRADEPHIRLAMNSGADDILLVPFSPDQLMQRMAIIHQRRKPFVVTHDYIGPDRRRGVRPGESSAATFAIPNPYLARSSGMPDERYAVQMQSAMVALGRARVGSLAKAAEWELRTICTMSSDGRLSGECRLPDDVVSRLYRVDKITEELIGRLKGQVKTDLIEAFRNRCQALASAPKKASLDDLARLHATAKELVSDWQLSHIVPEYEAGKASGRVQIQRPDSPAADVEAAGDEEPANNPERASDRDVRYALPPELAHLLKRIDYQVAKPPPPQSGFSSFDQLCEAAILRRIDGVMTFFHRTNASVTRSLPQIFLLSPAFAEKFHQAASELILPKILGSRQVLMLATSLDLASVDTATFWDFVPPLLKANILETWTASWEDLKLVESRKEDGTRVFQVKDNTKRLREILQPGLPTDYDMPRISNYEIEIFKSLLDPATDWRGKLAILWRSCHDLYEQERDPRVFQQKVREGALRDNLLTTFHNFPDQWGDFVILTCHRVFPRIDSQFLERFSTNMGRSEAEREAHMPYLIRYLRQVREHPEIRRKERDAEAEWQVQEQELRRFFKGLAPA